MKLSSDDERRQFGFGETILHPMGNIAVGDVRETPDGMIEWRWALRKGSRYEPEKHPKSYILKIEQGKGVFSIAGEEFQYGPGDMYGVSDNVLHGFVRVDTTTVVIQIEPHPKNTRP